MGVARVDAAALLLLNVPPGLVPTDVGLEVMLDAALPRAFSAGEVGMPPRPRMGLPVVLPDAPEGAEAPSFSPMLPEVSRKDRVSLSRP